MNLLVYFLLVLLGLVLLMLIIGMLLPAERVGKRQVQYNATPETVYKVVINNTDFSYRSDLKDLVILERHGEMEVWDEISRNGGRIRFKTTKKEPYSRYEFDIVQGNGFTGHWIGEFQETDEGGTLFTSTELIRIKNPFINVLSYLLIDLEKLMDVYQSDLGNKLKKQ